MWSTGKLLSLPRFYYIPSLDRRLPQEYIDHWKLLVEVIAILSKPTLHVSEIHISNEKLRIFVDLVPLLYQENYVTIKTHYLKHLAQSCIDYGSMGHFLATSYEDLNGVINNMNTDKFSIEEALY